MPKEKKKKIRYQIVGRRKLSGIMKNKRHLIKKQGRILLPTKWIGKRVKVILSAKDEEDI